MFTLASGISDVPFSTNNERVKEILNIDRKKAFGCSLKETFMVAFFKLITNEMQIY